MLMQFNILSVFYLFIIIADIFVSLFPNYETLKQLCQCLIDKVSKHCNNIFRKMVKKRLDKHKMLVLISCSAVAVLSDYQINDFS